MRHGKWLDNKIPHTSSWNQFTPQGKRAREARKRLVVLLWSESVEIFQVSDQDTAWPPLFGVLFVFSESFFCFFSRNCRVSIKQNAKSHNYVVSENGAAGRQNQNKPSGLGATVWSWSCHWVALQVLLHRNLILDKKEDGWKICTLFPIYKLGHNVWQEKKISFSTS